MRAYLCIGLGWGDESKGQTVAKLCEELPVDTIIRFNGGCQAAHHYSATDGTIHCFSQFGSGMLASRTVKTHLSRYMLVEPMAMMREADALNEKTSNVWWRTTVDAKAVIITPYHRLLNRLREKARGGSRHGSCGRGVGVAREMHLKYGDEVAFAGDFRNCNLLKDKLYNLKDRFWKEISDNPQYEFCDEDAPDIRDILYHYAHWPAQIVDSLEPAEIMVFEGAQGVLLDETHGTAPHNTWTDTTFNNADTLLDEIGVKDRYRIGCLRTYHTRHGAGPFPSEDNSLDLPELHNGTGEFQGSFRVGRFDWNLAKKAIDIVGGVDGLAISHLDYLPRLNWKDSRYTFLEAVEEQLAPVCMTANGPTAAHRTLSLDRKFACV